MQTGAFHVGTSAVHDVHVSPDGKQFAAGVYDGLIHLFELEGSKPKEKTQIAGHRAAVMAVRFSPTSDVLASGGSDGALRFWNVKGETVKDVSATRTGGGIGKMDFDPRGTTLALSVKGSVELWTPGTRPAKRDTSMSQHAFTWRALLR